MTGINAMWIDTHAHLYGLDTAEFDLCIEDAAANGVLGIINTATNLENSQTVINSICIEKQIYAAVGVSPFDADLKQDNWAQKLTAMTGFKGVVAIGETGLDSTNTGYPSISVQEKTFEIQLDTAFRTELPIVIHSRGAERRTIDMCKSFGIKKAVFHCYTGSKEELKLLLDCGYHVSFSGIITFKNNPLLDLISFAPLNRIMLETDSPYLAPVPHRGKPNRPAFLPFTGAALAAGKNIKPETAAIQIAENVSNVFGF